MNIQYYNDFVEFSDFHLDETIRLLEAEIDSIDFVLNEKERYGLLTISKKKGEGVKVRSDLSKKIEKIKKLLRFLGLKKKKLKQQGKDTDPIEKKIKKIKKKLK